MFTHQSIINHHLPAAGNHPSQSSSPPPPQPINIHQKYQKQFDSLGFLLLLRMNWLCAFEIEEVHDVNMIDSSFVPRTGCLEILGNAVLLQQFDEVIGMKGTSGEVLWTIIPSLHTCKRMFNTTGKISFHFMLIKTTKTTELANAIPQPRKSLPLPSLLRIC